MKNLIDNSVIRIIDTQETVAANSNNGKPTYQMDYHIFQPFLLVTILLLIMATIYYYFIKFYGMLKRLSLKYL